MSASPAFADSFVDSFSSFCNFSSRSAPPFCTTYSPIRSATAASRPFSSVISRRTSSHGDLSSLSTADDMVRSLSVGTPHTWNMPSNIFR